jgi:hypothetical protein
MYRERSNINAFEWEGNFKPMARQALKGLPALGIRKDLTKQNITFATPVQAAVSVKQRGQSET